MLSEPVAPIVEFLDDLWCEDRRGEETLLPVDHQVKVNVLVFHLKRSK